MWLYFSIIYLQKKNTIQTATDAKEAAEKLNI